MLQNGRLSFDDEETFYDFMVYLETIDVEDFLETLAVHGYKSLYHENVLIEGEEIDEPELETVLNQHGALEFNDYIVKLNFFQQEVYVIPNTASLFSIYRTEIAKDASNLPSKATVLSFDDDIWDFID